MFNPVRQEGVWGHICFCPRHHFGDPVLGWQHLRDERLSQGVAKSESCQLAEEDEDDTKVRQKAPNASNARPE